MPAPTAAVPRSSHGAGPVHELPAQLFARQRAVNSLAARVEHGVGAGLAALPAPSASAAERGSRRSQPGEAGHHRRNWPVTPQVGVDMNN